jgi:hypothetical protein
MEVVYTIFQRISEYSILIPVSIGFIIFKYLDRNSFLIFLLMVIATFPQLAAHYASEEEENILYNLYTVIDITIWGYVFFLNYKSKKLKFVIVLSMIAFILLSIFIFNKFGIKPSFIFELVCLASLMQICFILAYFYSLYTNEEWIELEKSPICCFSLGLLIYAPITYFYFAFYTNVPPDLKLIHNIINTLMYLVFSIGLLTNLSNQPKSIRWTR